MQSDPAPRSARRGHRPFVERFADGSDGQYADVDQVLESPAVFAVDDERLGVVGPAVRGTAGLVGTAVIEPHSRGRRWGTETCNHLLAEAHERDPTALCLLTTTAAGFFATVGVPETDRDAVPAAVRRTAEFAGPRPGNPACTTREVTGDGPAGRGAA